MSTDRTQCAAIEFLIIRNDKLSKGILTTEDHMTPILTA